MLYLLLGYVTDCDYNAQLAKWDRQTYIHIPSILPCTLQPTGIYLNYLHCHFKQKRKVSKCWPGVFVLVVDKQAILLTSQDVGLQL